MEKELENNYPFLTNYRVVLVSPMYSGNIGSVARLASNFDIRDIIVVDPKCSLDSKEAKKMACKEGQKILENIKIVQTLEEALQDTHHSIAFSRRIGAMRRPDFEYGNLPDLVHQNEAQEHPHKVALVFGRENNGLSFDELTLCSQVCPLPTSPRSPSLNLSQAVTVVLTQIYTSFHTSTKDKVWGIEKCSDKISHKEVVATHHELEGMIEHWRQIMVDVKMTKAGNPERILTHLRNLFQRSQISSRETRIIRGLLSKIQIALGTKKGTRKQKLPTPSDTTSKKVDK